MTKNLNLLGLLVVFVVISGCRVTEKSGDAISRSSRERHAGVSKVISLFADNGEFKTINIQVEPLTKIDYSTSGTDELEISTVLRAENDDALKELRQQIFSEIRAGGDEVYIDAFPQNYHCHIDYQNDRVTYVDGACIETLIVKLPKRSKTGVYVNSFPMRNVARIPFVRVLMALNETQNYNRVTELVRIFADSYPASEKILSSAQLTQLLGDDFHGYFFTRDTYEGILAILRPRLTDPENFRNFPGDRPAGSYYYRYRSHQFYNHTTH